MVNHDDRPSTGDKPLNTLTDSTSEPLWHVLGAGAMGCLWAARLWQHPPLQQRVALLLRSAEALEDYRQQGGLTLEAPAGGTALQVPVAAELVSAPGPALRHLLIATKAQDVTAALASVQHRLGSATRIVLLQNGVRAQQQITAQYGAQRVWCLSTSHGAWRRSPWHVVHAGAGIGWLGQLAGAEPGQLRALLALLPEQAMQVRGDADIAVRLWQKFAVNCAVNALTVVHDCANGELLQRPAARQTLEALIDEIDSLLRALPEVPALPDLHTSVQEVLTATAANLSSTLQDARAGRPTELDHLNGYLLRLARCHGLAAPLNAQQLQAVAQRTGAPGR
jgi:2-dehydropantoate 2-reductase